MFAPKGSASSLAETNSVILSTISCNIVIMSLSRCRTAVLTFTAMPVIATSPTAKFSSRRTNLSILTWTLCSCSCMAAKKATMVSRCCCRSPGCTPFTFFSITVCVTWI